LAVPDEDGEEGVSFFFLLSSGFRKSLENLDDVVEALYVEDVSEAGLASGEEVLDVFGEDVFEFRAVRYSGWWIAKSVRLEAIVACRCALGSVIGNENYGYYGLWSTLALHRSGDMVCDTHDLLLQGYVGSTREDCYIYRDRGHLPDRVCSQKKEKPQLSLDLIEARLKVAWTPRGSTPYL
jgi:hypothetical protein